MARKTKAKNLPNSSHVGRYCNAQRVEIDPVTKAVRGVFPAAFQLRTNSKETYLSMSHFEVFGDDIRQQFKSVVGALRKRLHGVKPLSAVARLNVGQIVESGRERNHALRVRDRSSGNAVDYAGLEGLPLDNSDFELLRRFASDLCLQVHRVAEIDAM